MTENVDELSRHHQAVIVVHGGAGTLSKLAMTPEKEREYLSALRGALEVGYAQLTDPTVAVAAPSSSAVLAVEAAVRFMEDCPLFNAGKGSVFSHEGQVEMDASIMNGRDNQAGAVSGVRRVRNPISAARAVMEKSKHVMMMGDGADSFASQCGLPLEDPSYFFVESRWEQLQSLLAEERAEAARQGEGDTSSGTSSHHAFGIVQAEVEHKFGTVGAVACDRFGNVAAATSTGGMTNKRHGRVGDSPIIGAGTFAKNTTCAVSCTGHGEHFIRNVVAHTVSARLEYGPIKNLEAVANDVVLRVLLEQGAEGGLIAVDGSGQIALPYNCEGMYRGYMREQNTPCVAIYDTWHK